MMEYWKSGILGSGIMQCWINGPPTDGIDDKIKMAYILLKTNIPAFQHSSIPLFHFRGKFESQKVSIFSVYCRKSDMFNFGDVSLETNSATIL
jgi:hypothetical protein